MIEQSQVGWLWSRLAGRLRPVCCAAPSPTHQASLSKVPVDGHGCPPIRSRRAGVRMHTRNSLPKQL